MNHEDLSQETWEKAAVCATPESILGLAKEEGFELNAVGLRTTAIWHFGNGAKCQVANGAMKVRRLEKGLPPVSWRKALNRLQLLPQLA